MKLLLVLLLCLTLLGCSSQPQVAEEEPDWQPHPADPYENWNRKVFAFNETVDGWVIKPAAQGYQRLTPRFVRTGVRNFFHNLNELAQLGNNLLQAKPTAAGKDAARFTINSILGLAGTLDVATPLGLSRSQEDFGQTLNVWGVPEGPYLVWPLLGGQTLTHTASLPVDYLMNPVASIDDQKLVTSLGILYGVQLRSDLLSAEGMISGDRYSFIRDVYLQRRSYLITDGRLDSDPFLDDDFDDMDFDDAFSD